MSKPRKYGLSVIGACGHVGLPLSITFADAGVNVLGVDINKKSIKKVMAKQMPFEEEGAQELLEKAIDGKKLHMTSDISKVAGSDYIIIVPGTAVDDTLCTDLSQLERVINNLMPHLQEGQTLILRSTLAPRTTDYLKSYIEAHTKFKIGGNLCLTFAPERIMEGHAIAEIRNLPQIIGAFDDKGFEKASDLFLKVAKKVIRTTPLEAELAKLFTNSWRYAQFALANEYAIIADSMGANIYSILDAVKEDYPRAKNLPKPGFARGPCLGKDVWLLLNGIPSHKSLDSVLASAYSINEVMPAFLVNKAKETLGSLSGKKAAVLGLTFKRDSDDPRDSLSYKLIKILKNEFVQVSVHDPYVAPVSLSDVVKGADVVFIGTNHSEYDNLDLNGMARKGTVVVDLWNVTGKREIAYRV